MSRSASDVFTRFTSTSPHASSKPPSSSKTSPQFGGYQPPTPRSSKTTTNASSSSFSTPPSPSNETPKEKVARLRAASRLAKSQASVTPVDRLIDRGRRWADNAHRFVAYGLIGFSGIAALVSIYAMTDLILHNRRQKRAWIDRELQRLHDARQAFLRGDATPEQLHLLQQERAGDEIAEKKVKEKERQKRESLWGRGKAALGFDSASETSTQERKGKGEEEKEDEARYGKVNVRAQEADIKVLPGERLLDEEQWRRDDGKAVSVTAAVKDMVDEKRRSAEKELEHIAPATARLGGPLDVLANNVSGAVKGQNHTAGASGWLDWVRGRGTGSDRTS